MARSRLPAALAAAGALALPVCAGADASPSATQLQVQAQFSTLDTNGNRLIDESEAKASQELQTHFQRLDQNNDGQLSEAEFAGFEAARSQSAVSDSKTEAISDQAPAPQPTESWFTAPRHKPGGREDGERGREPR